MRELCIISALGGASDEKALHLNAVKTLLVGGADPNLLDEDGHSPLLIALAQGQPEIVAHLIANGADADFRDKSGNTALHLACRTGDLESARKALANGAPIDIPDGWDMTPLHNASYRGMAPHVAYHLVRMGADVNAKGMRGLRPLHYAVSNKDLNLTFLLLSKGADRAALHPDKLYSCEWRRASKMQKWFQDTAKKYDRVKARWSPKPEMFPKPRWAARIPKTLDMPDIFLPSSTVGNPIDGPLSCITVGFDRLGQIFSFGNNDSSFWGFAARTTQEAVLDAMREERKAEGGAWSKIHVCIAADRDLPYNRIKPFLAEVAKLRIWKLSYLAVISRIHTRFSLSSVVVRGVLFM